MKSIFYLSLSVLFLTACSNKKETPVSVENTPIESDKEKQEPIAIQIPQVQFITFEDYANVNTKPELLETFSELEITHDTTYYAEGTSMFLRTTVYDPSREVYVNFLFEENNDSISFVEANYNIYNDEFEVQTNQNLASENGIYLGMPLEQLRKWNGEKIVFSGFGWDYGGGIWSDTGGQLKNSHVKVTLDMKPSDTDSQNDFYGDTELNSEMEGIMDAGIYVSQIVIFK